VKPPRAVGFAALGAVRMIHALLGMTGVDHLLTH